MQKLVIANRGSKEQGKTSSIREVFNILAVKDSTNVYIDYGYGNHSDWGCSG